MAEDLTGRVFGRLRVLYRTDDNITSSGYRSAMWCCVCECGNKVSVRAKCLKAGCTKSCGCLAREKVSERQKKHGESGSRLYAIWDSMRQRCNNKNNSAYHNYGARGISVCGEWDDYGVFREWAEANGYDVHSPRGKYTLDRIDVNGDYNPDNCRWITSKEQCTNKRDTIYIEYNGETKPLKIWADLLGKNYTTLWRRYKSGKAANQILA